MPAYRSEAEAEIRIPVVARLRELLPSCRIIHEIMCATHGDNRIDVLAVSETEIAAVEIKSSKDKLDRLPDQIMGMRGCANYTVAALHAKFFETTQWAGKPWVTPLSWNTVAGAKVWGFGFDAEISPECDVVRYDLRERHSKPLLGLPTGALHMMWRDELRAILARTRPIIRSSKLDMVQLRDRIRWELTGQEITREVCATLRERNCTEADAPIACATQGEER